MDPQTKQLLQMMTQPVFLVEDRKVVWHNNAAKYLVFDGQSVLPLLDNSGLLYDRWDRQGMLQIELSVYGREYTAKVCVTQGKELFVLEKHSEERHGSASTLMQVSSQLRMILQELMNSSFAMEEQLSKQGGSTKEAELVNRSIYRLLRMCTQMSDGGKLLWNTEEPIFLKTDLGDLLDTLVGEIQPLLEASGRYLEYIPCKARLNGDADQKLIERALYNLLANALQYSAKDRPVSLRAWEDGNRICFAVSYEEDGGFSSLLLADGGMGGENYRRLTGMGLDIVRMIAELHGGGLITSTSEDGIRKQTIFSIRKVSGRYVLRSDRIVVDEFRGFHRGLIELADVLAPELFHPDNI
ncbi:MAG: hypothetical protein IKM59_07435 [Oscillospiraceae bacterium]|nr:hypothetical protein [Oscillospiraceae bacterium]